MQIEHEKIGRLLRCWPRSRALISSPERLSKDSWRGCTDLRISASARNSLNIARIREVTICGTWTGTFLRERKKHTSSAIEAKPIRNSWCYWMRARAWDSLPAVCVNSITRNFLHPRWFISPICKGTARD